MKEIQPYKPEVRDYVLMTVSPHKRGMITEIDESGCVTISANDGREYTVIGDGVVPVKERK
jgi:hypothetical protein